MPEAAEALQTGQIDALIADAPALEYWVYTHPQTAFHVVGTIFHAEKYAFATPKRNAALMEAVSLEIMRMHDLERLNELKKRYFGLQR